MMRFKEIARPQTVLALAFIVALLAPVHAGAQAYLFGGYYGEDEIKLLPPYCRYAPDFRGNVRGGNNPAEIERWTERLGQTFSHMHHWCYGLIGMNRAKFKGVSKFERDRYCSHMLNEATYVIERSPPNFVLKPEFFTMRGSCHLQLGHIQNGFVDLRKAMDLKPDYWPPYVALSDYLKGLGDIKQAREVLQEAQSHAPDSKTIKAKLAELDAVKDKHPGDAGPGPKASTPEPSPKKAASAEAKAPETPAGR